MLDITEACNGGHKETNKGRLAVDLTPDEEYHCFHGNQDESDTDDNTNLQDSHGVSLDNNRRPGIGHMTRQEHSRGGGGAGSSGVTCSSGVGHVCSWYSRENTPDKTAKDIYNHEHLLTGSAQSDTKIYSSVPLDSEFKRHLEEEGNDFKDVRLYDEIDCDKIRQTHAAGILSEENSTTKDDYDELDQLFQNGNSHPKRDSPCFADAELSCCFTDAHQGHAHQGHAHQGHAQVRESCSRFLTSLPHTGANENHITPSFRNAGTEDESNNNISGLAGTDLSKPNCLDLEHELRQAAGEDDMEEDDEDDELDEDDESDEFSSVELPEAPPEIPVDMDEDVDEGMEAMDASLVMSIHGELCELDPLHRPSSREDCPEEKVEEIPDEMMKSIAEEIHDVLTDGEKEPTAGEAREGESPLCKQLPFHYPFTMKHVGYLFDKSRHHFTSSKSDKPKRASRPSKSQATHKTTRASPAYAQRMCFSTSVDKEEEEEEEEDAVVPQGVTASGSSRVSVATMTSPQHHPTMTDLEVTHRGLHRFIPRHADEINIGIGDPIHVIKEYDDLWCEGINFRTNERGIFPAMYANDLKFLDESDDDEEEYWKFNMKFLGSMEVTAHKGDDILLYAINKVAKTHQGKIHAASVCILEINQYGIRMIDKSKDGHEKDTFSHFFALKNISFCGTHPKDNRYFAFITKHPRDYKFACHVFHGNRPTHRARDALGEAFKRFYQEYMAFTHPTEDIYIE
ncbi:C-jun-amino-terminal kinase-interacting protein 1 [Plakobranchus ocellatus]|uniref:C-jun-amino-terminal kinase-interacting protein 1 n=1 Tax=Plakobranchus ocellatus TaxID=259542 RepID=A0AAV4DXR5_9GAST|nr:C-jun-amino-terminal kinase-interacting protein 1 [Plakobranchus ocellatus]